MSARVLLATFAAMMVAAPLGAQIRLDTRAVPPSMTGTISVTWEDDFGRGRAVPHTMLFDHGTRRTYEVRIDSATVKRLGGVAGLANRRVHVTASRTGIVTSIQASYGTTPTTAPGVPLFATRRVLVIPCRTGDEQTPAPTVGEYQNLWFGSSNSVAQFWHDATYGQLTLTGDVLPITTLPGKQSDYYDSTGVNAPVGDSTAGKDLTNLINACSAAIPQSVDLASYDIVSYELGVGLPVELGGYAVDSMTVRGVTKAWGQTISGYKSDPEYDVFAHAHELGHAITLFHSGPQDGNTYASKWDVMSQGLHTDVSGLYLLPNDAAAPQLDVLGMIPAARRFVASYATSTIRLERLANPEANTNYLIAIVPVGFSDVAYNTEYFVALRQRAGVDDSLSIEGVVIHERCTDCMESFVVQDRDGNGNPNDHGGVLQQGETFQDRQSGISVTVDSLYASSALVTIHNPSGRYFAMGSTGATHTMVEGAAAATDSIALTVGGPDASATQWAARNASGGGQWLSVLTPSGVGSGWMRFTRAPASLAPGTYYDTLQLTSAAALTPKYYYDTLIVAAGSALHLGVSVAAVVDSDFAGIGRGDTALVHVSGPGASAAAWTATRKKPWGFSVGTTNPPTQTGTGNGVLRWSSVTSNTTPVGWYVDTITVKLDANPADSAVVYDSMLVVPAVQYTVTAHSHRDSIAAGAANTLDSASIAFTPGYWDTRALWTASASQVPANHFLIPVQNQAVFAELYRGVGNGYVYWNWQVTDTLRKASFAPGTYVDTIHIVPPRFPPDRFVPSQGETLIVDTLVVYAPPVPAAALQLLPASRTDTVALGMQPSVDSLVVRPVGPNADSVAWQANLPWNQYDSDPSGILVFKSTNALRGLGGKGTGWLRYQHDLTKLAPGRYAYTIPIGSTDGTLNVTFYDTLVVLPGNALSLSRAGRGDTITTLLHAPVADSASLFVLGSNASSVAWTASAKRSFTKLSTTSGTGPATLRWTRDYSSLAAGAYVDTITVSAGALASGIALIDTVHVAVAQTKTATTVGATFDADTLTGVIGLDTATTLSVDMTPLAVGLASYTVRLAWDSTVVRLDSAAGALGGFGAPTLTAATGAGVTLTASDAGHTGKVPLARLFFHFTGDAAGLSTKIVPTFTAAKSDAASGGADITSAIAPSAVTALVIPGALRGDVNLDGKITTADALVLLRAMVGLPPSGVVRQNPNGDANCNGRVEALDAQIILAKLVGLSALGSCAGVIR